LILFAITLLFAIAAMISLQVSQAVIGYIDAIDTEKKTVINQTTEDIKAWYRANAASIDAVASVVPYVLASDRWGMTVLASNRFSCGDRVHARRYAVVLPGPDGIETTMDVLTGNITYGRHDIVSVIDGCEIQRRLMNESEKKAFRVVSALESYFRGFQSQEQFGVNRNYFTNSNCRGWGTIPCVNDGRNNANILIDALGINNNDTRDAWGNIMHFDNLSPNVRAFNPPFSCRIGWTTPWGDTLWITAAGIN